MYSSQQNIHSHFLWIAFFYSSNWLFCLRNFTYEPYFLKQKLPEWANKCQCNKVTKLIHSTLQFVDSFSFCYRTTVFDCHYFHVNILPSRITERRSVWTRAQLTILSNKTHIYLPCYWMKAKMWQLKMEINTGHIDLIISLCVFLTRGCRTDAHTHLPFGFRLLNTPHSTIDKKIKIYCMQYHAEIWMATHHKCTFVWIIHGKQSRCNIMCP